MASRTDRTGKVRSFERTPQGGIKAPAYLTRVGVFKYWVSDGSGNLKSVGELRLPEEVFSEDSLASLACAPVTRDHPKAPVTPETWSSVSIGHVGDSVSASGQFVSATVRIQDAAAVADIEAGVLREFSCGYNCDVEKSSGEYQGEHYDGIQRNIRYNHVGMGGAGWGRAGSDVRLRVDGGQIDIEGPCGSYDPPMTQDQIDALNAAHKKALDSLQGAVDAEKVRADTAVALAATETARADAAVALAATETLRADTATKLHTDAAALASPEVIEARVASRLALVDGARSVLGATFKADGVSDRDIRIAAIVQVDKSFKADGRSDEYIAGRYESVVSSVSVALDAQQHLRKVIASAAGDAPQGLVDKARADAAAAPPAWTLKNVAP